MPDLQTPAPPIDYAGPEIRRRPGVRWSIWVVPAVLVFLTLLMAAALVPKYSSGHGQAKQAAARHEISTLTAALDLFKMDNNRYPTNQEGIAALQVRPANAPLWRGPYLAHDVLNDPWDHPYVYRNPGKHNSKSFDVFSMGPDGREGGWDDIGNW